MSEVSEIRTAGLPAYFSDFIIDFLASLTPGVVFLAGVWMTVIVPVSESLVLVANGTPSGNLLPSILLAGMDIGAAGATIVSIILLTIAFVVGTLFSRLSPKKVDQISAFGLDPEDRGEGPSRPDDNKVEFPYRDLRAYLEDRGLHYLASKIPWDKEHPNRRTKHFINALKVRVLGSAPSSYILIARNEAHVRLASTTWFICEAVKFLALFGTALYLICILYEIFLSSVDFAFNSRVVLGVMIPASTGLVCLGAQMYIQKSFHYQRTREILHILEMAYWLDVTKRAPNIFVGLEVDQTKGLSRE